LLKIRLSRQGKKSQPSYRIIVQEHSAAVKGGKRVEELGFYNPTANPKELKVDLERVKYWLSVGAQPTDTMAAMLKREGMEGMEKYMEPRNKQRKKKKKTPEAPAEGAEQSVAEGGAPAEEPAKEETPKTEEPPAPAEEEKSE
jgi:small subunit ribosomal protein S16